MLMSIPASKDVYAGLDLPATDSIRLLTIEPGYLKDPVACTLRVVSLAQAGYFEALSYVWGTGPFRHNNISVNEIDIEITPNLTDGLRQLRPLPAASITRKLSEAELDEKLVQRNFHSGEQRYDCAWAAFAWRREDLPLEERAIRGPLWIDALCINQKDPLERAQQVRLMRDIYASAHVVNISLGIQSRRNVVHTLVATAQALLNLELEHTEHESNWQGIPEDSLTEESLGAYGFRDTNFPMLSTFYNRNNYFRRCWIVQEITLARKAIIYAADFCIEWPALGTAAVWMDKKGFSSRCPPVTDVSMLYRLTQKLRQSQRPPLFELASRMTVSYAAKPRDRFYSLLGISSQPDLLRVDYESDERTALRDAMRMLLKDDLEPISLVANTKIDGQYCTWAPDWRQPAPFSHRTMGQRTFYYACGTTAYEPRPITDARLLSLHGHHFDNISYVMEP